MAFQSEVFAWWAAHAVADIAPGMGLNKSARVLAVSCETGFPVDDVGVELSSGGFILVQAKAGMRRLDDRAADLRKAVDQVVSATRKGLQLKAGGVRAVDVACDRLVIATDLRGSQAFGALHEVCKRLRNHPASLPLDDAAKNDPERKAFATFRRVVEASWTAATGSAPDEEELRRLFRVVEVERLDFNTEAGVHRVRGESLLKEARATEPFSALVAIGVQVARERSWRSRRALATEMGVPDGGIGSVRGDVDRLKELTDRTLARLDENRLLATPDGDVRVARQVVTILGSAPESLLITGVPGAGKSGVVADLADLLAGDRVVLAVDAVPLDRTVAQVQWKLTVDLVEVLRAWDGSEPAFLVLDGLDAHRGGPSWLPDLVEELRGSRWRVIATIRQFELTHSHRWRRLFRGKPIGPPATQALVQVRHLVVPNFDEDELAKVAQASPSLGAVLDAGDDQLRELLANPFILSLAGDLVGQVPIAQLAGLRAQVQVLAAYWQVRVLDEPNGLARSKAADQLVERMTAARVLELIPDADLDVVEQLVSRGVLHEVDDGRLVVTTKPVRFRHHVVFDFALAASLRGTHASRLSQVLAADPEFVLFGRPAIDFHLLDLWLAEEVHHNFWDTIIGLAEPNHALAVAAAAAAAIRQISSPDDVLGLIKGAGTHPTTAVIINYLAGALDAADEAVRAHVVTNIAAFDALVGALGTVWLDDADPVHLQAMLRLMWALQGLSPLPRQGPAAQAHAASIVRMLKIALDDPASQGWLGNRVLHLITGALPLHPDALPALLQCLDPTVTAAWGLLPLRPVLEKLADIAQVDAPAAGRLAAAPFLFDASAEHTVPLGYSQILAMTQSWSQAHGMLRYGVTHHGWAPFEAAHPGEAMHALAAILEPLTESDDRVVALSWNGLAGKVGSFAHRLDSGDRREVGKLVDATVAAMAARAANDETNESSLRVWATRIIQPEAWRKLLQAGTSELRLALQLRGALLETGGLFIGYSTRPAAIRLAATLSPLISDDEHQQLEQIALGLSESDPDRTLHQFHAETRDNILLALDPTRIQTDEARTRLDELTAPGDDAPASSGTPVLPGGMRPPADDWWDLWGIDPATLNESVRTALVNAGSASGGGVLEPDRWSAIAAAVVAEGILETGSALRSQFRDRIGRLVTSLLGSVRLVPDDVAGAWIADLILALADNAPLPSPPEQVC